MKPLIRSAATLALLLPALATAQSAHDPWAYCQAWDGSGTHYVFSAPTQIRGSDYQGLEAAWKAFARQKLGGTLRRAECTWAYTASAAPQALKMAVDDRKKSAKNVEMTGWVWSP